MHRDDFPMIKDDLIYLDNGATTFKPKCVLEAMNDYYENYSANAHRGDYSISYKVDVAYENARVKVAKFINAEIDEIKTINLTEKQQKFLEFKVEYIDGIPVQKGGAVT